MRIYVTDQLDTKSLLGNYVCGETVGEFEWREGPLSSIVRNGGVLILENFQEAKDELVELITDVVTDNFKVRGERVQVKDSFRAVCTFTVATPAHADKLADIKRATNQAVEIVKTPVTLELLLRSYRDLTSNSLVSSILSDLFKLVEDLNKDPKSELKCTVIEASSFLIRVNNLFTKTFKGENPIHFSINFKLSLVHLFYDIYLAKFRNTIPETVLARIGDAFKITAAEIRAYLDSYHANPTISESSVISKRYGTFYRGEPEALFNPSSSTSQGKRTNINFFATSLVGNLAEAILGSSKYGNQMLLVGEAGCGKTTIVQETAALLGKVLHVFNMSQSSDVSDLIGGFKPLNAKTYISETADDFCTLLREHFDYEKNVKLVSYLKQLLATDKTTLALMYMARETTNIIQACDKHLKTLEEHSKDHKAFSKKLRVFRKFAGRLGTTLKLRDRLEASLIFKFIQGNLVSALRQGQWILLDEINLAQPEVLQHILPILENRSIILVEKGELKEIKRHPDFKLFGCMNPGNTVGKKELPQMIRKNFIEYFVKELEDPSEIMTIIKNRSKMQFQEIEYQRITQLYLKLREQVNKHMVTDGFNRKPTISLRGLSRAIDIALVSWQYYPNQRSRAVIEGLFASFSSNLGVESKKIFSNLICEILQVDTNFLSKAETGSIKIEKQGYINIEGFLLKKGSIPAKTDLTEFLLTGSVKNNLVELLRVLAHSNYPILLEGPTSAGKTSMIKYLGERSGNKVVRINNHQHTDLDEYVGTYSPDERGRLIFKEGLLIEAMRNGYWIILDELNLARSEILEALNRLLDDNRELYVPEINQVVVPHPDFRIFATQNPLDYAGRKELSVAFRSRFFHFFIGDIADEDLVTIIEARCQVPRSRSAKLVEIMKNLRVLRSRQNISAGKESLITIRDLIKWAGREIVDLEQMAFNGYCLLAERLRYESEREQVKAVLQKLCLKSDQSLEPSLHYRTYFTASIERLTITKETLDSVFWSESFVRMYSLVMMAIEKSEPVLLIGETGCGKTTIADLVARIFGTQLYTVNCHQYTESSDFLGGLRPSRGKDKIVERVQLLIKELIADFDLGEAVIKSLHELSEKVESEDRNFAWDLCSKSLHEHYETEGISQHHKARVTHLLDDVKADLDKIGQLFEWVDGPLIQAMTHGGVLLIDEISLAQDSVLERLNSVLEKEKTIMISEKGDGSIQEITAHANFKIIATMNPSGDYGKKELTPALRNRFTEVWVEPITSVTVLEQELEKINSITNIEQIGQVSHLKNDFINFLLKEIQILEERVQLSASGVSLVTGREIISLLIHGLTSTFNRVFGTVLKPLTIRDIKSSIPFILRNIKSYSDLGPKIFKDYVLILLGGFKCLDKAVTSAAIGIAFQLVDKTCAAFLSQAMVEEQLDVFQESETELAIGSYSITKQIIGHTYEDPKYSIGEDVVKSNLKTILMALTLEKAIMLEGPPGVGKTSLIQFLAQKVGIKFYRVNLNEQTDMIDLLGSDVPSSNSSAFSWADGVLIQAMKQGAWILLDELNMATQTVLEGLNSILDHRGSIYLPELDQTIHKHPRFRIFASQNPMSMGSGRKGLPHSFLTRFTRVWIEELSRESLQDIIRRIYKKQLTVIPNLDTLVEFFFEVKDFLQSSEALQLCDSHWEFNLRDLHKMIQFIEIDLLKQITESSDVSSTLPLIQKACNLIIMARLDNPALKLKIEGLFRKTFSGIPFTNMLEVLGKGQLALPQHLYHGNATRLNLIVEEPLLSLLGTVIESGHPLLFLYDSRSENSFIDVESLVSNLASKSDVNTIKKISLFNSSDIIDLIGSYEQVVPTEETQKKAAVQLIHSLSNDDSSMASSLGHLQQCFEQSTKADSLFSWRDSELCTAIRQGDWVVLKGAELVNPAILERLNGLLEEKEIFINEAIGTGKEIETVVKSDNFRIFILYDKAKAKQTPSRALRNRCIEINFSNFEVDLHKDEPTTSKVIHKPVSFEKLQQIALKHALYPLDSTDEVLLDCEKYLILDRLMSSADLFKTIFENLLVGSQGIQSADEAKTFRQLATFLQKTLQRRANFTFEKKASSKRTNEKKHFKYKDCLSSGDSVLPMTETLAANFSSSHGLPTFDTREINQLWIKACQSLSTDTDDMVEESLRVLDEREDKRFKVLAAFWILACKKSKKSANWIKPLEKLTLKEETKHHSLMLIENTSGGDLRAIPEEERSVQISGGFVSPLTLCLNVLYGYLMSKSEAYSSLLDRSSESKHARVKGSVVWIKICKLFERGQTLKSAIVGREFSDNSIVKQLVDIVRASLSQNVEVSDSALSAFLDLISESVESSFAKILESVSSQFIDYDMLDEVSNLTTHKFVYKPKKEGLASFLAFLSRAVEMEQLQLPERILQVASHAVEAFERVIELDAVRYQLHHQMSLSRHQIRFILQGRDQEAISSPDAYLKLLATYYKVAPLATTALRQLLREGRRRGAIRLAGLINQLNHKDYKVSDWDCIASIEDQLAQIVSEAASDSSKELPELQDLILLPLTDDGSIASSSCLRLLDVICRYVENPSQNAVINLLQSLSSVVEAEMEICQSKKEASAQRRYESLFAHSEKLRKIQDQLTSIGRQLKTQKTRQISRHHFETEEETTEEHHRSLSYFVSQTLFRILHKNSCFLADSDVQEMKRLTHLAAAWQRSWHEASFLDIQSAIADAYRLLQGFINSGHIITFGDCLLPFFGNLSQVFFSAQHWRLQRLQEHQQTDYVSLDDLGRLRQQLEHADLSLAACAFLSLSKRMTATQNSAELRLLAAAAQLAKETAIGRGRSMDEASKLKNLAKGVERTVRDEYTKEAVDQQKADEKFEILRVFGVEADIVDDPRYKEAYKYEVVRSERKEFLKQILDGMFLYPKEGSVQHTKNPEIRERAVFDIFSKSDSNLLDIKDVNEVGLLRYFSQVLRKDLFKATETVGQRDIRKSMMLEQPGDLTIAEYEAFWIAQMKQFVELEENSFYKGKCVADLVNLRPVIFELLDKVQELRGNEDLRELPSFNNIVSVADVLLSLQLKKATLNEVCLLLEKLSTYVLDYESITPRRYHFPETKEKLRDALYGFRQVERKSWRGLIFCQGLDQILEDLDDCIQIKKVILEEVVTIESDEAKNLIRERKLLDLVDAFLTKISLLKQMFRLFWLLRVLKCMPSKVTLPNFKRHAMHLLRYHLTFLPSVLKLYKSNFEGVGEPIKQNEKLSNWHMKDLVNMKMNVTKFHKGIQRSMKLHKEVLEISIEGQVYKHRRDGYLAKDPLSVKNGIEPSVPDKSKETEKDKDEKTETKKVPEEKPPKVLGKGVIDRICAKSEYQDEAVSKLLRSNLKLCRLVKPEDWLPYFNEKPTKLVYKNYESSTDQCHSFIKDWMETLENIKDVQSKSNRLRVLDGFLKTLTSMGIKDRQTIENWDPLKLFGYCPNPIDADEVEGTASKELVKKLTTRSYEMVDMLYINKANLGYTADLQPSIRRKIQGYMVNLAASNMDMLKKFSKAIRVLNGSLAILATDPLTGVGSLTEKEKTRFEAEFVRYSKIHERVTTGGFMGTKQMAIDCKIFALFKALKAKEVSVQAFNDGLQALGYKRAFASKSPEQAAKHDACLFTAATKLQNQLAKDMSNYDVLTKTKYFLLSQPAFMASLPARLLPLQKFACGHSNAEVTKQLATLLTCIRQHLLTAASGYTKFQWMSARVLHNLVYSGLCVAAKDDEDKGEEGETEYDIGTGVGEGQGDENATNKYEFEEQVLGEKGNDDEDEDDNQEGDDNDEQPGSEDEQGGESMEVGHEDKGMDDRKDEDKDKEEKDEDQEMSSVDEGDVENDLWDKENEDMDEESEESQERRDDEAREYKDEQPQAQGEKEQKAKEPTDKEQRDANDYEEQEQGAEEQSEADKEADQEKSEEENKDEYAEVESRSAMSDRNENDNMDFDEEEEENQDKEENPEEDNDFDLKDEEQDEENKDKEDDAESEMIDDPLDKKERKMKEEDDKNENAGELDDKQENVKNAGLNPEVADEAQDKDKKEEENPINEKEKNTKDGKGGKKKTKIDEQKKEKEEAEEEKMDEEALEKEDPNEQPKIQEAKREAKEMKEDSRSQPKDLNIPKDKLASVLEQMLMAGDDDDEDDADDLEGLAEGGDIDIRVKKTLVEQKRQAAKKEANENRVDATNALDDREEEEKEPEDKTSNKDDKEDADDEAADKEKNKEITDELQEEGETPIDQPQKKLKQDHLEEIEEKHLVSLEDVNEYLTMLNDNEHHLSSSNNQWSAIEPLLRTKAYNLCEELRQIFKPTKIAGLKGDFRTGKRLNMRKVISYVASNYRKDKIWLRRSDPSQRDYEIALAIDDTLSMSEKNVGYLALESLIILALALSKLEVGKLNISGIRSGLHEVLPFTKPFIQSDGQRILDNFDFTFSDQHSADLGLPAFLSGILEKFTPGHPARLMLLLTDGRCNKDLVRPVIRQLENEGILVINIILDKKQEKASVLNIRSTTFETIGGVRKPKVTQYMDDYPFSRYVIVQDTSELVSVLVSVLREVIEP